MTHDPREIHDPLSPRYFKDIEDRNDYREWVLDGRTNSDGGEPIPIFLFRLFRKEVSEIVCKHLVGEKTDEEFVFEGPRAYDTGTDVELRQFSVKLSIEQLCNTFQHSVFLPDEDVFLKYALKLRVKYEYNPALDVEGVDPSRFQAFMLGDLILVEHISERTYIQFDVLRRSYEVVYPPFVYWGDGRWLYDCPRADVDICFDKFEVDGDILSLSVN